MGETLRTGTNRATGRPMSLDHDLLAIFDEIEEL